MKTLLLSRTCQPEADRLARIALQGSWKVGWVNDRCKPQRFGTSEVAIYAETDIALAVAEHLQLALIEPSFDLLTQLPIALTKRRIEYMTLAEARKRTDRFFAKPADCTNKVFDAGVCENGQSIRCPSRAPENTRVLVAEPVLWDIEYRSIVLNRQVVAMSPYIRGGWLARDETREWPAPKSEIEAANNVCEQLLQDASIELPPAFTLDIGLMENQGWAVIEFNPVWCSGLLGCELVNVLPALEAACCRRDKLPEEYSKWIVMRN